MESNTIFDDVFRTMLEKMPQLAVPLINEVFGTSYPEDVKIIQKRNEHQTQNGRIITDSHLLIANRIYHIECQSTDDSTMVIRMIEYDFAISLAGTCTEGKWQISDVFSTVVRTVFARHKKERYDICGDCDARW